MKSVNAVDRRLIATSLAGSALVLVVFFAVASPSYEINDDMMIALRASGAETGTPDEYIGPIDQSARWCRY